VIHLIFCKVPFESRSSQVPVKVFRRLYGVIWQWNREVRG